MGERMIGSSRGGDGSGAFRRGMIQVALAGCGIGLTLIAAFWLMGAPFAGDRGWTLAPAWARALLDVLWIGGVGALVGVALTPGLEMRRLMQASLVSVSAAGVIDVGRRAMGADFGGVGTAVSFMALHSVATYLLGWRPPQALAPAGVWFVASTMALALGEPARLLDPAGLIAVSLGAGAPGVVISAIRDSAAREREEAEGLGRRFEEVNQDLLDARQIHEGAFPSAIREGSVQFTYEYYPMSQIGGDYLHAHVGGGANPDEPALSLALLDVTGHGIAAALTVNRLHGELTRLYAENPDMRPIDALRALNRYIYLTLSGHAVLVTAFIMRADPSDNVLEYASAGHPPAFLRSASGVIEELGATAMVLGAMPDEDFMIDEAVRSLGPGDSVVAYTDGAIEVRNSAGEMLGVEGLREVYRSGWADAKGRWPAAMVHHVERYRAGEADDDTLIVELFRTLGGGSLARDGAGERAGDD